MDIGYKWNVDAQLMQSVSDIFKVLRLFYARRGNAHIRNRVTILITSSTEPCVSIVSTVVMDCTDRIIGTHRGDRRY